MEHKPACRNPDGVVSKKPIALRLMPDERADAERISAKENESASRHARKCYLAGKNLLYPSPKRSSSKAPRKRFKRGGGGSSAPAASLSMA